MYRNIGKKIKAVAVICAVLFMLAAIACGGYGIVTGIDLMDYYEEVAIIHIAISAAIIVVGVLFAWISSFALFGYGQLIDNTDKIVKMLEKSAASAPVVAPAAPAYVETPVAPMAPVVPEEVPAPVQPETPAQPETPVAAAPAARFCINCGNKVAAHVLFCPKCGNKMD